MNTFPYYELPRKTNELSRYPYCEIPQKNTELSRYPYCELPQTTLEGISDAGGHSITERAAEKWMLKLTK
jgi:hypothetical protein